MKLNDNAAVRDRWQNKRRQRLAGGLARKKLVCEHRRLADVEWCAAWSCGELVCVVSRWRTTGAMHSLSDRGVVRGTSLAAPRAAVSRIVDRLSDAANV